MPTWLLRFRTDIFGMAQVIKDNEFTLVSELVKTDSKKRISLGLSSSAGNSVYQIYTNRLGQIVLDPVKAVPAYETSLFENPEALAAEKRKTGHSVIL